ncbi:MAG TPA: hypothetical protein VK400_14535 [Pyrinomonadaceae bacterium]|nr:hypothetical protein [Pyrinomonadaceae bacterium]
MKKDKPPPKTDKRQLIFNSKTKNAGLCLLLFAGCLFAPACQTAVTPVGNLQTPTPTPEVKEKPDEFSEKLEYVQKGAFTFIYVFRRKDGAPLDTEDRKFLRANSLVETNQWVLTDDAKAAIAGSNYQFPPEMLDALKKRFSVEDLSKPPPEAANPDASPNANGKTNSNAGTKANSKPNGKAN